MCPPTTALLLSEGAALGQAALTAGGLGEDGGAVGADNHVLGVGEHGGDVVASLAANVHEEGVGALDEALELVLGLLLSRGRVQ